MTHKAAPQHEDQGVSTCRHCGYQVLRVPGGHGPTWVHAATGMVAAPGAERSEGPGPRTLVVEIPATLINPTWTDKDLRDNAVDYITSLLFSHREDDEGASYTLDTDDLTLWVGREDYLADLREGNI